MPTYTAQTILDDNRYTIDDFSLEVTERIVDKAANYISVLIKQNLPNMAGTIGEKTLTINSTQDAALQLLVTIMLREAQKTALSNSSSTNASSSNSKSVGIGGLSVAAASSVGSAISASSSINNAANTPLVEMFYKAIENLQQQTVNDYSQIAFI